MISIDPHPEKLLNSKIIAYMVCFTLYHCQWVGAIQTAGSNMELYIYTHVHKAINKHINKVVGTTYIYITIPFCKKIPSLLEDVGAALSRTAHLDAHGCQLSGQRQGQWNQWSIWTYTKKNAFRQYMVHIQSLFYGHILYSISGL